MGTKVTKNNKSGCGPGDEKAMGMPAPIIRIARAIMERLNHRAFEAASGRVRMIHHDPIPSPPQATKYIITDGIAHDGWVFMV
jgi:hypothetical protein